MPVLILLVGMVVVGVVVGFAAGFIWKGERPIGVAGDYIVAVLAAVVTGLLDWYVIPAMGFSQALVYTGVVLEPPLVALGVLWLIRRAKRETYA